MNPQIISSTCQIGTFPIQLAIELQSTELAIMVQFFVNVISKHKRSGRNLIDGSTWNFCSREVLKEIFPFWSEKMIRTRLDNLISLGILKTGNFNKNKYDRTLWYAFVDEVRWGIDKIEAICPNGPMPLPISANECAQKGQPIPLTKHRPNHMSKVNEADEEEKEIAQPKKVIVPASPSVTFSEKRKRSLFKGKVKYTDEQAASLDWLRSLGIDTSDDNLSWWARNYSLARLETVYRESVKRKPKSLGAYMQNILKKELVVIAGRIEANAEYAKMFKEMHEWNTLEIHQKYAIITTEASTVEIDFNMESDSFIKYLTEKFNAYGNSHD